ncbi:MAG: TolC family protein, partial [Acidobacteriaceae bacterium]|nr:TolC family protein [Acidobacteriaceae bacterium]
DPEGGTQESRFAEKFRLDSLSLLAKQREFEAQYKPSLNAFANAGLNASYLPDTYKRFGMSAGVLFAVPIYDGHQKRLAAQESKIAVRNLSDYKANFLTQREVNRAKYVAQMASYDRREALLRQQLDRYDKVLADYRKLMAAGEVSVVDYLLVVKNRMQTQKDYIVLQANSSLLISSFNYWNW